MAYLAIKKVKGKFYAYRQESYREGSKVKTRTLEYLGAVDPVAAQTVKDTRRKLAQMDIRATTKDAKSLVSDVLKPTDSPVEPNDPTDDQSHQTQQKVAHKAAVDLNRYPQSNEIQNKSNFRGDPQLVRMRLNGVLSVVNVRTGEVIETDDKVITTKRNTDKPTRSFHEALKLSKNLERYGVNATYLQRKHLKFGNRLKAIGINPSHMPDIIFKYGHPDGLKRNRDGSFVITISRRTQNKRHPIAKGKMWEHYRQALITGYLEAIRKAQPDRYDEIASKLDHSHQATKQFILDSYRHTDSLADKFRLSLQLMFFDRIPKAFHKSDPLAYGQMSFTTLNNWKAETVFVLTQVEKSGWDGVQDNCKKSIAKLKGQITRKRNQIDDLKFHEKLAGKLRKLIRQIMKSESQLKAAQSLQSRLQTIKSELEFF